MLYGSTSLLRMSDTSPRKFRRVLLKLSGEALRQPGSTDNISPPIVEDMAAQIKAAHQTGLEIALVVGGGNFWRGVWMIFDCREDRVSNLIRRGIVPIHALRKKERNAR